MNIAQRCQQIFGALFGSKDTPVPSIRKLSEATGIPKSSVHRHKQAIEQRQQYPESSLWETSAGSQWLGVLDLFGK